MLQVCLFPFCAAGDLKTESLISTCAVTEKVQVYLQRSHQDTQTTSPSLGLEKLVRRSCRYRHGFRSEARERTSVCSALMLFLDFIEVVSQLMCGCV